MVSYEEGAQMWRYVLAVFFPGVAVICAGRVGLGLLLCVLHMKLTYSIPVLTAFW
jgi:uncharacterized membrane protein YqaE (UPF0057 family)